jgi:hypothetical protein
MYVYRTNPDDTEVFYAPGIGVTGYGYHHHGSPDSRDLVLTRLRLAP